MTGAECFYELLREAVLRHQYYSDNEVFQSNTITLDTKDVMCMIDYFEKLIPKVILKVKYLSSFDMVWLEDIDKDEVISACVNFVGFDHAEFLTSKGLIKAQSEDYLKRWRAWTFKPTDEKRKSIEWGEPY